MLDVALRPKKPLKVSTMNYNLAMSGLSKSNDSSGVQLIVVEPFNAIYTIYENDLYTPLMVMTVILISSQLVILIP